MTLDKIARKSLIKDRVCALNRVTLSYIEGNDYAEVLGEAENEKLGGFCRQLFAGNFEHLEHARTKQMDSSNEIQLGIRGSNPTWRTPSQFEQGICEEFITRFNRWAKSKGLKTDTFIISQPEKRRHDDNEPLAVSTDAEGLPVAESLEDRPDDAGECLADTIEKNCN